MMVHRKGVWVSKYQWITLKVVEYLVSAKIDFVTLKQSSTSSKYMVFEVQDLSIGILRISVEISSLTSLI